MTASLYSQSWYRVAGLKPRLRNHLEIHRHHYRGELWYVLQDHASGNFQRFTPVAYQIIGLMDGKRTVQEIWETVRRRLGDESPTQDEVIRLLTQLHGADALQTDVVPDTAELLKRFEKRKSMRWKQNLKSPLFVRFRVLDPERFLNRFQHYAKPFFGWPGGILWLLVVGSGVFQVALHWPELTENLADRILSPGNLLLLWFVFPFLKIFHEFGHAFAIKVLGGEVHEMGIMMLVFTPIPYVDASAASALRSKGGRILVGAAGMAIEVFIGSIALLLWVNLEPGPARSLLYNIIFIAGVSSLFFNGNPLLRYDAYYMLADLLEIPNLAQRGLKYVGYLVQRYPLGDKNAEPPPSSPGERFWFIVYTVSSWSYRILVYVAIVMFVATKFFFIGVLFAIMALFNMFVWPALKGIKFLVASPRLKRTRFRGLLVSGSAVGAIVFFIFAVPIPLSTLAEGIIWIPENCFVRAGTAGFVERLMVPPGGRLGKGDPVVECSDPLLPAELRILDSHVQSLQALYDSQMVSDRVKMEITRKEIEHYKAKLEDARQREKELTVYSDSDGVLAAPEAQDLPGRFVKRGELLGYVLDDSKAIARVVVYQGDVDLVRGKTSRVQVRFADKMKEILPATLVREVPAATDRLPGRTLSVEGGGEIAIDPRDRLGITAFQKVFLFDLELPSHQGLHKVGGRLHVRFSHGKEPLAWRWYRDIRQLFLKRFNI